MPDNALRLDNPPPVVAVRMCYGHLRAAAALADHWGTEIVEADREPNADVTDRLVWSLARRGYHALSRLSQRGVGHAMLEKLLDRLTAIDDREPPSDPHTPRPVRILDTLIRRGFGKTLGRRLDHGGTPAVATFYANAIAAERHSSVPVACVVTDSHVHRVWAPRRPAASRIHYLVPVEETATCLERYGVPRRRIRTTGFPLPPELVGTAGSEILAENLRRRLGRLRRSTESSGPERPIRLTVAIGGAGAQAAHVRTLLAELRADLVGRRFALTLVAGTHQGIGRRFRAWADEARRSGVPPENLEVLSAVEYAEYYHRFNRVLADTDLLWTKPSELVFYAALGLPLILEPAMGDHERRNRTLVVDAGAAADRPAPGEIAADLRRRLADGWFLDAAENGRARLIARGTERIASYCSKELYGEFTGN